MKPFSVLLALGLLIPLSGEEPSAPETAKPLLFKDSFQREFQELTEMLEREYPAFLQSLSPADSGRALSAVMGSLRSGVVPEAEAKPASVPAKAEPDAPAFRLKNGLWYLRINTLNEKTFGELLQTVRKAAQSPGLILDLRGCSAGDWTVRPESLRTLLAPSVLHTAILLGPGRHGARDSRRFIDRFPSRDRDRCADCGVSVPAQNCNCFESQVVGSGVAGWGGSGAL